MAGEFDDLYGPSGSWWTNISDETREWCLALIEDMKTRGREPTWSRVHKTIKEKFPDDAPAADSTLKNALRKRLNE